MPSLKVIKKRITSVKSTQKITRAMKLVSAAKLRRATERAHNSRPFEAELIDMVSSILNDVEWSSPLTEVRAPKKIAAVIITSDRGLCGSLTANLLKLAHRQINAWTDSDVEIIALGRKGGEFFRKRGFRVAKTVTELVRKGDYAMVSEIAKELRAAFVEKKYDRVEIFYSKFQSALVQTPTSFTLLPFAATPSTVKKSFLYEPTAEGLLSELVPMLIDFRLFRVTLESIASEHGARMSAMESATKNAKDMIERLTLMRNRARQAAITKELMEIIGGAEALAG